MKFSEIAEIIDEVGGEFYGEVEDALREAGYEAEDVYQNSWGEGMMEDIEYVIEVKKGSDTLYVMLTGWYGSYSGSEYQGCKEVKPYTFTETRYK